MTADPGAIQALSTLAPDARDEVLELSGHLADHARVPIYLLFGNDTDLDAAREGLSHLAGCQIVDLTALVGGRADLAWRSATEVIADVIRTASDGAAPGAVIIENLDVVLTALTSEPRGTAMKLLRLVALRRLPAPVVILMRVGATFVRSTELEPVFAVDGRKRIFVVSPQSNPSQEQNR